MAKKNFKIRVKFVFSGSVIVRAHDRKEAEAAAEIISNKVGGGCEVAMLPGGQPIYDYVISVEN